LRRFLCYFTPLGWRQLVGAGLAALRATELPKRNSGGIPVIGDGVACLSSRDVSDQFRQREGIAGTFSLPVRHVRSIAQSALMRIEK
jgi:hypothetical protein